MGIPIINDNSIIWPRGLFGWILLAFVIGSLTLTGRGQLMSLGALLFGSYSLYFLRERLWVPKEIIIFSAWVVWSGTTGYIVSFDKGLFLGIFKIVFQMLAMAYAVSGITINLESMDTVFLGLIIGGIILFLSGVISGELLKATNAELQIQVKGLTNNPNDYGYGLLMCEAALLYFWRNASNKQRLLIILLVSVIAVGIVFSGSRKSFSSFILLIILWLYFCYKKEFFKRPYLFIVGIFLLGGMYFAADYMLSNTYMGARFQGKKQSPFVKSSEIEGKRKKLYREGFALIEKNPIFGVGFGNFKVLSSLNKESHSDYIEVATSTGIVGFVIYFSIYFSLWNRLIRIQKRVSDPSILYNVGLCKAMILITLVLAFGMPIITNQTSWILLSSIVGYSWSLENKLLHLRNA